MAKNKAEITKSTPKIDIKLFPELQGSSGYKFSEKYTKKMATDSSIPENYTTAMKFLTKGPNQQNTIADVKIGTRAQLNIFAQTGFPSLVKGAPKRIIPDLNKETLEAEPNKYVNYSAVEHGGLITPKKSDKNPWQHGEISPVIVPVSSDPNNGPKSIPARSDYELVQSFELNQDPNIFVPDQPSFTYNYKNVGGNNPGSFTIPGYNMTMSPSGDGTGLSDDAATVADSLALSTNEISVPNMYLISMIGGDVKKQMSNYIRKVASDFQSKKGIALNVDPKQAMKQQKWSRQLGAYVTDNKVLYSTGNEAADTLIQTKAKELAQGIIDSNGGKIPVALMRHPNEWTHNLMAKFITKTSDIKQNTVATNTWNLGMLSLDFDGDKAAMWKLSEAQVNSMNLYSAYHNLTDKQIINKLWKNDHLSEAGKAYVIEQTKDIKAKIDKGEITQYQAFDLEQKLFNELREKKDVYTEFHEYEKENTFTKFESQDGKGNMVTLNEDKLIDKIEGQSIKGYNKRDLKEGTSFTEKKTRYDSSANDNFFMANARKLANTAKTLRITDPSSPIVADMLVKEGYEPQEIREISDAFKNGLLDITDEGEVFANHDIKRTDSGYEKSANEFDNVLYSRNQKFIFENITKLDDENKPIVEKNENVEKLGTNEIFMDKAGMAGDHMTSLAKAFTIWHGSRALDNQTAEQNPIGAAVKSNFNKEYGLSLGREEALVEKNKAGDVISEGLKAKKYMGQTRIGGIVDPMALGGGQFEKAETGLKFKSNIDLISGMGEGVLNLGDLNKNPEALVDVFSQAWQNTIEQMIANPDTLGKMSVNDAFRATGNADLQQMNLAEIFESLPKNLNKVYDGSWYDSKKGKVEAYNLDRIYNSNEGPLLNKLAKDIDKETKEGRRGNFFYTTPGGEGEELSEIIAGLEEPFDSTEETLDRRMKWLEKNGYDYKALDMNWSNEEDVSIFGKTVNEIGKEKLLELGKMKADKMASLIKAAKYNEKLNKTGKKGVVDTKAKRERALSDLTTLSDEGTSVKAWNAFTRNRNIGYVDNILKPVIDDKTTRERIAQNKGSQISTVITNSNYEYIQNVAKIAEGQALAPLSFTETDRPVKKNNEYAPHFRDTYQKTLDVYNANTGRKAKSLPWREGEGKKSYQLSPVTGGVIPNTATPGMVESNKRRLTGGENYSAESPTNVKAAFDFEVKYGNADIRDAIYAEAKHQAERTGDDMLPALDFSFGKLYSKNNNWTPSTSTGYEEDFDDDYGEVSEAYEAADTPSKSNQNVSISLKHVLKNAGQAAASGAFSGESFNTIKSKFLDASGLNDIPVFKAGKVNGINNSDENKARIGEFTHEFLTKKILDKTINNITEAKSEQLGFSRSDRESNAILSRRFQAAENDALLKAFEKHKASGASDFVSLQNDLSTAFNESQFLNPGSDSSKEVPDLKDFDFTDSEVNAIHDTYKSVNTHKAEGGTFISPIDNITKIEGKGKSKVAKPDKKGQQEALRADIDLTQPVEKIANKWTSGEVVRPQKPVFSGIGVKESLYSLYGSQHGFFKESAPVVKPEKVFKKASIKEV